jgi:hypothetical protein
MEPFKKVLDTKKYFTRDIEKAIKIYTIDKYSEYPAHVIGSLSYRSGNASDIDMRETIIKPTKDVLIRFFKENLIKLLKNIHDNKKFIFCELKCGLDYKFDINIGDYSNDKYNSDDSFFEQMTYFKSMNFIDDNEYKLISDIHNELQKTQIHYEVIKKLLRNHYILRWTYGEVQKGYKILKNINGIEYKYYLEDAVCEKSNINIEGLLITNDNKYSEVSNFFMLKYGNNDEFHMLNLSDDMLKDFKKYQEDNLKSSMYVLVYSKIEENLFKCLKRMLSYGRINQNIELIRLVYPLINSQLGVLYNINSQFKTIMNVLKNGKDNIYKEIIYNQLDIIRFKLQDLIYIDYNFQEIYDLITIVLSKIEYIKIDDLYEKLLTITKNLLKYINIQTMNEMIRINLYPLPFYLQPENKPF